MRSYTRRLTLLVACLAASIGSHAADAIVTFRGMSDASAAVAIGDGVFIVGDDEVNKLRVYNVSRPDAPIAECDLTAFLRVEAKRPEADIEGATAVGDRVYWITSHGRNKDGKLRPNRYRFFATRVTMTGRGPSIRPIGHPCATLVQELVKLPAMLRVGIEASARLDANDLSKKERERLAPKKLGLNIEALCASQDGKILYIGFRNPKTLDRHTGRTLAIAVPLLNAPDVVENATPPSFGEPLMWDLAGRGIRGMTWYPARGVYLILAGPSSPGPPFSIYHWNGKPHTKPTLLCDIPTEPANLTPETMIVFNDAKLLIISDDGTVPVKVKGASECLPGEMLDGLMCPNKYLLDPRKKFFRGLWLRPWSSRPR